TRPFAQLPQVYATSLLARTWCESVVRGITFCYPVPPRMTIVTRVAAAPDQLGAYEEYYGLLAHPFGLTPDLRFVYPSRSHSHAFEQVTEALQRREGLIVITGEIGTSKTVLCRTLLETFEARTFLSVILDPCLSVGDLLQQVLSEFGLISSGEARTRPAAVALHQLVS